MKNTKSAATRLKIARGHLDRVIRMVENDEYCIAILQQSLAVQSALKKVDEMVLKNHLETCVAEAMRKGKKDKAVAEVIEVFRKGRR